MFNPLDNRTTDELREATQVGERTQAVMDMPGWADVIKGVKGVRDNRIKALVHSGAKATAQDYADKVGEIRGLEQFELIVKATVAAGENAEGQLNSLEAQE